jgi:hypothetical protein
MNELVGLAIRPGPTGHNARTALLDVYTQDIGPEKRQAILNTAQAISERFGRTGGAVDLSVTVAFMAACAPLPPLGENGPGHVDANLAHVARNLPPVLQRESDLLAANRAITGTELLATGAKLENLNVWDRLVSMATPGVATKEFEALGHQALRQLKSGAVWLSGSAGHHIAVVAEPVSDGIRFHVIARPGDEQAPEVQKALKSLSFGGSCIVTSHEVEHPHRALEHLNANDGDVRGAGGVIQEHVDDWSSLSPEDRQAITLASQAKLFEAVAASASQSAAQAPLPTPEVALPARLARPKSLEDNFNTQGLTVHSGRVHSAFDAFAKIFSLKDAMLLAPKNPQLMASYLTTFHAQNDVPNKANFLGPALAFADGFNEGKAPLLFKDVDPSGPLASISKTLHGVGSGRKIIDLMVKHQQTLLQECRDAKDLSQLKKKLEEVVEVQAMLLGGIDTAIAELEKFESENLTSLTPELAAQAKEQAKDLLAVSKRYRDCLTGEISAEGNVYADFVAFAKQATTSGPSLEAARAMFKGIGGKVRTVPTPAPALQGPPLEIVVKLPEHVLSRTEMFAAQNLQVSLKTTTTGSTLRLNSLMSELAVAYTEFPKITNLSLPRRVREAAKLKYDSVMARLAPEGIDGKYVAGLYQYEATMVKLRNTSLLFDTKPGPWAAACDALKKAGALTGGTQYLTRLEMPLNGLFEKMLEWPLDKLYVFPKELAERRATFIGQINNAITEARLLAFPSEQTLKSWKDAGLDLKSRKQLMADAAIAIDSLQSMLELSEHKIYEKYRTTFAVSEGQLPALVEHLKTLPSPAPPSPSEFLLLAGASGFGKSTEPNSALAGAMARVKAAQDRSSPRSLLGRPLNNQGGALAKLNLVTSPEQLDNRLHKVSADARAVQVQTGIVTGLTKSGGSSETVNIARGKLAQARDTFLKTLAGTKEFVESQIDVVDESIEMLKTTEKSTAGASVKADAMNRRQALEGLRKQWEDEAGPWRQIVKFTELGALYPDEALNALNGVGASS